MQYQCQHQRSAHNYNILVNQRNNWQDSRLLLKHNVWIVFKLYQTIGSPLRNIKDRICFKEQEVMHEIPCSDCNHIYLGQTNTQGTQASSHTKCRHFSPLTLPYTIKTLKVPNTNKSAYLEKPLEIEKQQAALNKRNDGLHLNQALKMVNNATQTTMLYTCEHQH